jgi:hypothetical protein
MKILKSKYRSSLSDKHLNECMRVAITHNFVRMDYCPKKTLHVLTYCIFLNETKQTTRFIKWI